MNRTMLSAVAVAALVYIGLCAAVFLFQRSLMYFPTPPSAPQRGAGALALPVDGARVVVTSLNRHLPDAVVYFGGNAEDVNYSLPDLASAFPDHGIYLMQYRGYGESTGKPSEPALAADALALYDTIRPHHRSIMVVGRSIGAGIALRLASARPVERLVLVTPFDSAADVAARHYPFVPARLLLRDKYESAPYASAVTVPTTLIVAERDEIVPRSSVERLLARFPKGIATLAVVPGTGHNTISASPQYLPLLKRVASGRPHCEGRNP
jgi:pimeloyl-ACP methyl ester carboxylesterase